MKSKTFLMTSSYYPPYHLGGACVHVYQLANALAELGHEVHIIYSLDWYYLKKGKSKPRDKFFNNENVILHPIKSSFGAITPSLAYMFGYYFPLSEKIIQTINDIKPDIIHHHNITGFGPFLLEAKAEKVIYTAHDQWLVCPTSTLLNNDNIPCINPHNCNICSIFSKKPPQIWRYKFSKMKLTKNIDTIISPSNFIKETLIRLGISNKIEVIPNFVEINRNERQGIYNKRYLLYVGRLEYYKGIIELIESFYEVLRKTEYDLVIAGDGSLKNKVKAMASSEKSQGRIHYLGQQDPSTLGVLYGSAAAVIIPSIVPENCPMVALESISYGTPIITIRSGGLIEIIENTNAGVFIERRNVFELKNDLIRILNDEDLLETIKNNARIFNNYYSKENYIKKYFHLIDHD